MQGIQNRIPCRPSHYRNHHQDKFHALEELPGCATALMRVVAGKGVGWRMGMLCAG